MMRSGPVEEARVFGVEMVLESAFALVDLFGDGLG